MNAESRKQKAETETLSPRLRHALALEIAELRRAYLEDAKELAELHHKINQVNAIRAQRSYAIRRLETQLGPNPFDTLAPQ